MWTAIGVSLALLALLLARGWGEGAWGVAAGVLLLSCIAVCVWAAVTDARAARLVDREVARLIRSRRGG